MKKKGKKSKKSRPTKFQEGASQAVGVRSFMGDVALNIPRKALRYLDVKPGDKLQLVARKGTLEISPMLTIEDEIKKFISH